jgi:hypothetical protein
MPCRTFVSLLALFASAAIAQPGIDASGDANAADEDEVVKLVREMREAKAREQVVERAITVYTTHFVVGERLFDNLDDAIEYIEDFPPTYFALVRLAECGARARMEEILKRQAERLHKYIERVRDEGRGVWHDSGIGAPLECPW